MTAIRFDNSTTDARRRRRFLINASGMAATEFALILPMTMLLFFGMLEGSNLMLAGRRLTHASNTLADLVAQQPQITHAELADVMIGVRRELEPSDTSSLSMRVVSVIRDPDDSSKAIVHWSRDHDGATPYSPGSEYTKLESVNSVNSVASLVVVEFSYVYDSGLTSKVFDRPYRFERLTRRWPRVSPRVQLCDNADPANCTS